MSFGLCLFTLGVASHNVDNRPAALATIVVIMLLVVWLKLELDVKRDEEEHSVLAHSKIPNRQFSLRLWVYAHPDVRCPMSMRERWGALSVRDHISDAPLVAEVLLYDRLVIPVPDPNESLGEQDWEQKWQPELLYECLDILKVKTEGTDGLALTVPWDKSKRERFNNRMSMAAALATQQRYPEMHHYMDPFAVTRMLIKEEFRPALPPGVSKAWTVAAYPSTAAFRSDISNPGDDRKAHLAFSISHQFLTPTQPDPKHEILKRAVDLATSDDFRRKRAHFYNWQEKIIQDEISDEKAIEELEQLLLAYGDATQKTFNDTVVKYVFTVIPIGLTMAGAVIAGAGPGLVIAGSAGLVELARFWNVDRKPVIADGDLDAAAMVHDDDDGKRIALDHSR